MNQEVKYSGPERRRTPRGGRLELLWRPLFEVLRWIGRHVEGFYAAVGLFLTLGLALALLAVGAFALMARLMAEGMTQRFDEAVLLWLNARANPTLDIAALEITALGGMVVVWMLLTVSSVFLWVTRHRYSAALLWVAVIGGSILNSALKALFDRPRPDLFEWRTEYAGQSSFPSGHAMTAMVMFATLAYLIARLEPTRLLRRLTLGITATVIVLIGLSRLYLGVHYPSDVIAGYIAGFAWATFCALGIEAVRYFRGRRPQAEDEEKDLDKGTEPIRDAVETHPETLPRAREA